ncbi:MAG: nicotinate phosphoribosyltransferase [Planctomycetes bacterium]|nr:nicotinate phosphoribosyltransferase [Planctomycetota bacterium]
MRREDAALFTDLYELTMLQSYLENDMRGRAVFDLFVRRLPARRNYLLACGLDDVLDYLEDLRFSAESIDYLAGLGMFSGAFLEFLRDLRFRGNIYAMPEGTPVFALEPIVQVEASLPEAQLVETYVMNQIHFQTLAASKASRVVAAARGRTVVDFGARRMHGTDAALKAARAFAIAGVHATSNVLAGGVVGLPVAGTMAHSYVQAHDSELEAFRRFAGSFPQTTLLVDTYDTLAGIENVIRLSRELGRDFRVRAVRLDSGDLAALAHEARRRLDDAGLRDVQIFASSSLDEEVIDELLSKGAPIDGFGVGSKMGVSSDAPYLDMAYKLSHYEGRGRMKLSEGKSNLPGRKQVFRCGSGDVIALDGERVEGRPLLIDVMREGRRLGRVPLAESRATAQRELGRLPERYRAIKPATPPYDVALSPGLEGEIERVRRVLRGGAGAR